MKIDVKLEPCPFCGGEASLRQFPMNGMKRYVECGQCRIRTHLKPNRAEAIAAWNTRTAAQPQRADVAGLVERALIVKWLQDQSEKGADYGLASGKGTTRRAAFGGGALALHRAAEAIARGDHIVDDTDGQTESQQPLTALFAPASERETVLAGVAAAKQKMQHCRDELNVAIETLVDAHVALTTPAPAVSRDEIDELLYSVIRMPLSNKGGELVRWRKTMSGRLSAILKTTPAPAVSTEEIVAALEPFAFNIDCVDFLQAADDDFIERAPFKAGDYRRAAAILSRLRGEG